MILLSDTIKRQSVFSGSRCVRRGRIETVYYLDKKVYDKNSTPPYGGFTVEEMPTGLRFITTDPRVADRLYHIADKRTKRLLDSIFIRQGMRVELTGQLHPEGLSLYPFQREALDFILSQNRAYLAADPGTGKTIMAACWTNVLRTPTIYIAPPCLIQNVRVELERWLVNREISTYEEGRFTSIQLIPDNASLIGNCTDYIHSYICRCRSRGYGFNLIVDEAHRFKEPRSERTKWLFRDIVKQKPERILYMSGTPMPNRPKELFTIVSRSAPELIDFKKFNEYGQRYCGARFNGYGFDFNGTSNLDELRDKLTKFMYRIPKEKAGLPGKHESCVIIGDDVSPEIMQMERKELKNASPEDLISHKFDDPCIATYRRLLGEYKAPIAARYIDYLLRSFDTDKFLVFALHKTTIAILRERLKKYDPSVITGSTPTAKRQHIVDEFNHNGRKRLYIAHHQAGGVGFNIQSANRVIMVETPWVPGDTEQSSDRAHRIGQEKEVYVQHLVFKNSIDRKVVESVIRKRKAINKLYGEGVK